MDIGLEIKHVDSRRKVIFIINGNKKFIDLEDRRLIDLCLNYTGLSAIVSKYGASPSSLFSSSSLIIYKNRYSTEISEEIDYIEDSLDMISIKIKNRFEIAKKFVKESDENHSNYLGKTTINV
jgi:hypothetical protein